MTDYMDIETARKKCHMGEDADGCRFLAFDIKGFECLKQNEIVAQEMGTMTAKGDYCKEKK